MFSFHVGFHIQSSTEDHLTNWTSCLPLVYILVFIQRTLVKELLPADLAVMPIHEGNNVQSSNALPVPRIPHPQTLYK
jgi:hypothetical protein